ncbi:hypothetical protein GQF03_02800 [Sneathiella chungangensis]|uniref:Flagellar protein FlaG n=1 Tax=Sneathiella chungangensis TaxID=1418234 RepID=A0A845MC21_9PROT|nr:flagellar protein FlaG [Sneathiella chungangensis]MZR21252.1 hypothetical protein [Sneathiella chungangensis]
MDVTPYAKQDPLVTSSTSGSNPARNDATKSFNEGITGPSENEAVVADPVKRAEAAIGGLFTDSRFPTGRFSIDHDQDSGRYVYRLVDRETEEVLKQFPGDYVLRRVAYYRELQGIAVNSEV